MKLLFQLLVILIFSGNALAQSSQAIFDEANSYFTSGELNEAMQRYRSIEKNGIVSGALYLNMGLTAIQLDSTGLAKYYFLKALEFDSTKDQAENALQYVNTQFSRQSATLPKLPWDRAVEWLNEGPGAFLIFNLGIVLICIGLLILITHWYKVFKISSSVWVISGLLIVGALIVSISFYIDYVERRYQEGVIIIDSRRVLQEPAEESNLVSIAYEGYDITIDQWKSENTDGWLYVRLGNGQFGWIKSHGVKVL